MKTTKLISLSFLFFVLVSVSCKKSSTAPVTSTSGVTFKFNGTAKSTSVVVANYIKSQQNMQIIGKVGSGTENMGIMINIVKVGTFNAGLDQAICTYGTTSDYNNSYIGDSGSVTVTSFTSTTIAGTFQFIVTKPDKTSGTVTEGKFNLSYITQ